MRKEVAVAPFMGGPAAEAKCFLRGQTARVAQHRKIAAIEAPGEPQGDVPAGGKPEAVRIRLLGGFSVSVGDRTVWEDTWRLRKAASLVKLLALAPGHRLHREQVMELLWPDLGRRAASNNLRQALYTARQALEPYSSAGSRYLASQDESLRLCPGGFLVGGCRGLRASRKHSPRLA